MKIIIVGAGISGLSTYLHLRKHLRAKDAITIYESHKPQPALSSTTAPGSASSVPEAPLTLDKLSWSTILVGGGLGISPNGMRVLRDLDESVHDDVVAQGFPAEHFVFKGANGWMLGMQRTSDANVRKDGEQEVCISSSRHGLWEMLMKKVGPGIVRYSKVVGVERTDEGKVVVKAVNEQGVEESDVADLVVGADGAKSVARNALFGEDERFKPRYTGLSGVGGFLKEPIPGFVAKNKAMVFIFGRNGFFGYSSSAPASSKSLMWWSTFETNTLPATKNIDTAEIKDALVRRHQHWNEPVVRAIISKAEIQSIYPTWVLDGLPHWGENGIVLVGDSAHAMDPSTGQGASQALEDSQTLALLLAKSLKDGEHGEQSELHDKEAVALTLKLFYQIRQPRVQEIAERGKKIAGRKANVGVVGEYSMYFFFWMLNRFPWFGKLILGDVNRKLYTWSAENEIQKAFMGSG